MRFIRVPLLLFFLVGFPAVGLATNGLDAIKKAVQRSTLNQPGTKPFHLKADLAPSFERDKDSGRTGEIEIWWKSPTEWKREVRCPEFHQIAVVNGTHEWQKNDGDYFPAWLRNIAVELIEPVPRLDEVLQQAKNGEVRRLLGMTHFSWVIMSSNGTVQKTIGAGIAVSDQTGLLLYGGGSGWGGQFKDYKDFHGRMVPTVVSAGSPEVTAKVLTLEDLRKVPSDFFTGSGNDVDLIRTVIVDEPSLRENLVTPDSVNWPPLKDGPLEGALTTEVVVDRAGKVRDVGTIITDNPGISAAAREAISEMRFKPFLLNGAPVQVVSRITMPFKTVRPPGLETFDSARNYFERGRSIGFPASGAKTPPYLLRAIFQARIKSGSIENGLYVDTFKSSTEWRREATIGSSRYVRSQLGGKRYELAEGPDAPLLRMVLEFIEPIPALDTFYEADWRIKRDSIGSMSAIRVASGYESPDGVLDPEHFRGYWFDEKGNLIKTFERGIETRRSDFSEFAGFQVAQDIQVLRGNAVAMVIHVTGISPTKDLPDEEFKLKGHEWTRAFTAEVR